MKDELADFIAKVTQCAERGPPHTDPGGIAREVDAKFSMDKDDGVMVNSAALWPLLAPHARRWTRRAARSSRARSRASKER
ncbi:hypothetical protein BH09MYX1_BH09MYX1_57240 [soil metagenome]